MKYIIASTAVTDEIHFLFDGKKDGDSSRRCRSFMHYAVLNSGVMM